MKAKVDAAGRILIPKELRNRLGIETGSTVDIQWTGETLSVSLADRTRAPLIEKNGRLVIGGTTPITDDMVRALIDEGRR